jgi:hypothetical protein
MGAVSSQVRCKTFEIGERTVSQSIAMGEVPEHPRDDHRIRPLKAHVGKMTSARRIVRKSKPSSSGQAAVQAPPLAELI